MKRHRRALTICGCVALLTIGCSQQPQPTPDTRAADEAAIREADAGWSKAAAAGQLDASLAYNSDDALFLPPNSPMVRGKAAIRKAYEEMLAIPGFSISWQTAKVEVARSGDLAYAQGAYEMAMNDAKGNPVKERGKYLTIWKKQADGTWKSVADTFNSDLPLPAPPAK